MRNHNILTTLFFGATIGIMTLTGCEGGDLYDVNSPDWLAARADSIAEAKKNQQGENTDPEGEEDVYTIGKTDYTSGWWADFSKDYPIKDGEVWNAIVNVNINPSATNTYKNFALILTSDAHRGEGGYVEYGAIRFDNQPSGNSEWGDYIDRSCVSSTLTFETDTDAGVEKLGGKTIITIDRSDPNAFSVTMTNGTVTKTYKQKSALPNLNADAANTTIRAFLVVEGSFLEFKQSNLEPIGGFTSKEDKQPLTMTLKGAPRKVLLNADINEAMANLTADIEFEQGVSKTVGVADLQLETIPDLSTLGTKTLIAIYNKTYKGETSAKAVVATATFEVVETLSSFTCVGNPDNSSGWWTAFSENVQILPGETHISTFTNYTSGLNNWNNFCVILNGEDVANEYGVVRCDNYGWGTMYDGNASLVSSGGQADWAVWLAAMEGAKVTTAIRNNGDGTADIDITMIGNDGETYIQFYHGLLVNTDDLWFRYVVDGSHIEFDNVLGNEDNTTGWWTCHSENLEVPAGSSVSVNFTNYTNGLTNWNNFCVVLNGEDVSNEYGVVRSDNYGWGSMYEGNEGLVTSGGQADWGAWLAAMDGAKCNLRVTNNGDGTADIDVTMIGNDGETYTQFYHGLLVNSDDLYFRLTIEGGHIVFE